MSVGKENMNFNHKGFKRQSFESKTEAQPTLSL